MANKTKAELIVEIEELNKKLFSLEQEVIKYEQVAACANVGEEYKLIYDNYISAGFTEDQAFRLIEITVERTIDQFTRDIRYSRESRYRRGYVRY